MNKRRVAEKKFMTTRIGCNWRDYKTNTEIINELKITVLIKRINVYKSN